MATKGFLEQARNREKTLALMMEGKNDSQIAALLSTKRETVSRAAIGFFRRRHAEEVKAKRQDIEKQVEGIAIAAKRFRLNALEALFVPMYAQVLKDGPLIETRAITEDGEIVVTGVKAHPLLLPLGRYLRWAAEEMGQIPRWQAPNEGQGYGTPGDVALAANVETQNVIIYRGGPELGIG